MPAATAPDVSEEPQALDFEAIFREHARMVYRTARALTGSAEEADDVVQTVFLRLVRGDFADNRPTNLKGYLYRSAVNLSLDVLRARRRRTFIRDLDDLQLAAPIPQAAHGPAHHDLDAVLAQLDPKSLEILTLRYVHGYTDSEIARLLGASRGAIALRLFRLRGRLKRLLRSAHPEKKS